METGAQQLGVEAVDAAGVAEVEVAELYLVERALEGGLVEVGQGVLLPRS